jgi:hypothetical protein
MASDRKSSFSSMLLYGLGGAGKTQIALAYAFRNLDTVDVVLWIPSETIAMMEQTFTRVALDLLKIPSARPQDHASNRIFVLDWLQKTSKLCGTCL